MQGLPCLAQRACSVDVHMTVDAHAHSSENKKSSCSTDLHHVMKLPWASVQYYTWQCKQRSSLKHLKYFLRGRKCFCLNCVIVCWCITCLRRALTSLLLSLLVLALSGGCCFCICWSCQVSSRFWPLRSVFCWLTSASWALSWVIWTCRASLACWAALTSGRGCIDAILLCIYCNNWLNWWSTCVVHLWKVAAYHYKL